MRSSCRVAFCPALESDQPGLFNGAACVISPLFDLLVLLISLILLCFHLSHVFPKGLHTVTRGYI